MREYYKKVDAIVKRINKELNINMFDNKQQRLYVDARSLLVKIMRDDFFFSYVAIQKYFNEQGKVTKQHGTIMNLYKQFQTAKDSDRDMRHLYFTIMNEIVSNRLTEEMINRIRHIEDSDVFFKLEKQLDKLGV